MWLPTSDIAPDLLPEAEADRIFVLAHRWALDTAEALTLIAEEGGDVVAATRCRIATPASLVAMKLQFAPKRRATRAEKAGGDYLDLLAHTGLGGKANKAPATPWDPGRTPGNWMKQRRSDS